MRDSQGRAVAYPAATPTPVAPSEHLLPIAAVCFAFGWLTMAVILRHRG